MKKTISILLIVTMLLSMFLAAIPMSAAESAVDDGKTTPGHENYEHKDAAYFEGLAQEYTRVTNYEEFCAIESGSVGNIKYYYLDLSEADSETLVMSGKDHDKFMEYIYFDFNGYSVDVSGVNNAVFGTLKACTVKNLKIVGNLRYGSDRGYYADKVSAMGKSPLTNTAYNHENNGIVHLDNIVSSVNWTISQQHGMNNKPAGGIINDAASGSTFNKCVFDGTITAENDESFMAADAASNLSAQPGRVGGIVGTANGCVFTDCENRGAITVADGVRFGYSNDEATVGGIVGRAGGNNEFDNCKNSGNITINAKAIKSDESETSGQIGGIVGYLVGGSLFSNCENTGKIEITNGYYYVGGIIGNATSKATVRRSSNGGDITAASGGGIIAAGGIAGRLAAEGSAITDCDNIGALTLKEGAKVSVFDTTNNFSGLGGVLGLAAASVTVEDCDNTGAINVENGITFGSCVFGAGGVVGTVVAESEIDGCNNEGEVKAYITTVAVSGILGNVAKAVVTISDCATSGAILGGIDISAANVGIIGKYDTNNAPLITDCTRTGELWSHFKSSAVYATQQNLLAKIDEIENLYVAFKYTEGSWAELVAAVAEAKANNEDLSQSAEYVESAEVETLQEKIGGYYDMLLSACLGLELKPEILGAIATAVEAAEKFIADNSGKVYTAESWSAFASALATVKDVRDNPANATTPEDAISALTAAKNALVLGGDIVSGSDFAKLEGQSGVFYLTGNITVTAPVNSFKGKLYGNGYTITLDGCALFNELNGAEIYDLNIAGNAGEAYSLLGKAAGTVRVEDVKVDTTKLAVAALFDIAAEDAVIHIYDVISTSDAGVAALVGNVNCAVYVSNALVMADAPALLGTVDAEASATELAYVDGKVFVDANGSEITDAKVFASGAVAYAINTAFGEHLLGQRLGDDALPVLEGVAVDGLNVVIAVYGENGEITGYENDGHKYVDDEFVTPPAPETVPPKALDLAKLNAAIEAAEALAADKYTADSWAIVQSLLNSAKAALSAKDQAAADMAADSLNAAVSALVEKVVTVVVPVDYSKLDAAIAKASTLRSVDYSAGTWGTLQTMLALAKIARTATTQTEVDQALAGLESAITTLKAPEVVEDAPATNAPATDVPAPADSGCGSVIGGAAVILTVVAALGAGISFKKKED